MSRIAEAFDSHKNGGKAFIPYLACGDPDLETTAALVREMARRGADLIELGVPFSDPTAEGPVIQQASLRALQSGTTTDKIFNMVRELREDVKIPMVFMTYANVVFSYSSLSATPDGTEKFLSACEDIGMDGLILPDVPFEEKEDFDGACSAHGLDLISLIAPTSADRIARIARGARGFIYIVSSLGVTGVRKEITTDIASIVRNIRENSNIPCAVGFGISTPEQARTMSRAADGVIVGSAIVKLIAQHGRDSVGPVGEYVRSMKDALRG